MSSRGKMTGLDKGSNRQCGEKGLDWMCLEGRASRYADGPRFLTLAT